jgi:replicative DNA helicase
MSFAPVQNIESEQSTLGAMCIEQRAVDKSVVILNPADFYRDSHQTLYDVITTLSERQIPVDLITVQEELRNRNKLELIGGMPYLTALFETVPTAHNVEYYAKIVREKAILRRIDAIGREFIAESRSEIEDIRVTIANLQELAMSLSKDDLSEGDGLTPARTLAQMAMDRVELIAEGQLIGITTGLTAFDRATGGLQKDELIIIAGRPSMGKTTLVMSMADHVEYKLRQTVAIFSLETEKVRFFTRLACMRARVDSSLVETGKCSEEEYTRLNHTMALQSEGNIHIDHSFDLSIVEMRNKLRALKRQNGLGLIVVDYLQLMNSPAKSEGRTQAITEISRGLKSINREFGCPVIALAQLSREVDKRDNKRPMLSDLRDSGAIEADADKVIFPYREAYYKQKEAIDTGDTGSIFKQDKSSEEVELIIAKNRNGRTGWVKVGFNPALGLFHNLARDDEGPTDF